MTIYTFAVEGCAESFEHPDDAAAVRAARAWAATGLYAAHRIEVSIWQDQRHVADFTFTVGAKQREAIAGRPTPVHGRLGRRPREA